MHYRMQIRVEDPQLSYDAVPRFSTDSAAEYDRLTRRGFDLIGRSVAVLCMFFIIV